MSEATPPGAMAPPAHAYRIDRLRLRHLRLLELVDAEGSLGGAARELGISQPAVTLLARELETVFGAALIARDARGARLTHAGRQARDRLRIALETIRFAMEAARQPEHAPTLRVGCVQLAGFSVMPAALGRWLAEGSLPHLHVAEAEALALLTALAAGELDCVIGWLDEAIAARLDLGLFHVEPLWSASMRVFAARSHPLARRRRVRVAELADWPWVVPQAGSRTHAAFQRLFLNHGLTAPRPRVACTSVHSGMHIVAAGGFIGIGPERLVASYAASLGIRALDGTDLDTGRLQLCFFTPRAGTGFAPAQQLKQALLAAEAHGG